MLVDQVAEKRRVGYFLHALIGAGGGASALDAANILKPALARGKLKSAQVPSEDEQQDAEEEEDDDEDDDIGDEEEDDEDVRLNIQNNIRDHTMVKKILEQEPEMLPCHASASPLSPQLSTYGTPRMGPSIKVWDPYNVLARPAPSSASAAPLPPHLLRRVHRRRRSVAHRGLPDQPRRMPHEFEAQFDIGPVPRCFPHPHGKRQARALAVFLKSQGVRFNTVYTSPLDRVRATAQSVCQELNFSEEHVQSSDALVEMSQGHWEAKTELLSSKKPKMRSIVHSLNLPNRLSKNAASTVTEESSTQILCDITGLQPMTPVTRHLIGVG
ncbi:hypothetical protein PHJA_002255200 [Phtheirospermum japonicum]|uniref:Uncharacterized protein n=1 Tax=Phtheirospermum japonicum TaxID=374723 RepID=A0A830CSC4_9LAMI|nr:hypothetical protein PHJA_002255200 [Phtheirospermum japonicum]